MSSQKIAQYLLNVFGFNNFPTKHFVILRPLSVFTAKSENYFPKKLGTTLFVTNNLKIIKNN